LLSTIEVGKEREGSSERKPVMFMLAGFPDDHSVWANLADEFKVDYRVVLACLPDYDKDALRKKAGYSFDEVLGKLRAATGVAPVNMPLTSDVLAGAIIETVDAVTWEDEKVTLVIHDWGCFFGYHFAGRRPEKVEAVVALDIGAAVRPPKGVEKAGKASSLGKAKNTAKVLCYQLYFAASFVVGRVLGSTVATYMMLFPFMMLLKYTAFMHVRGTYKPECTLSKPIQAWMCYPYYYLWRDIFRGRDLAPPFPQCRTLFMWGTKKAITFHSKSFLHKLKDTDRCAYAGVEGGHWFFLDQHETTVGLMKDFLLKGHAFKCAPT